MNIDAVQMLWILSKQTVLCFLFWYQFVLKGAVSRNLSLIKIKTVATATKLRETIIVTAQHVKKRN